MSIIEKITHADVSRRTVLKGAAGTSLALGVTMAAPNPVRAAFMHGHDGERLNAGVFLELDTDGTAHITIHRQEMGQGSRTGIPQIIADELEADWDRINFIQGLGDEKYGDQNTDGSTSIRGNWDRLRLAGATARFMLRQAGAAQWGVSVDQVKAENHRVINTVSGESKDYGDLVAAAANMPVPAEGDVPLKSRSEWRYIEAPKKILDMEGIVTGTADFGQDVQMEGMLYAVAARPPVAGGSVKSFDKAAAMAIAGVVDVIELPKLEGAYVFKPLGGVAVLATNTWAAMKGREALNAQFEAGPNASYDSVAYEKQLWQSIDEGGTLALKRGEGKDGLAGAASAIEADYYVPHLVHAPMEPPAATAHFAEDGTLDVYTHGQDPQTVKNTVAPYAGIAPKEGEQVVGSDRIRVHSKLLGGAFGRKSKPDFAAEATVLAKATGKPVKMVWTREDDMRHGFYHTVAAQRVQVGLDESGKVATWNHRAAYPSIMNTFTGQMDRAVGFELGLGLTDMPFDTANIQIETCKAPAHLRIGWLRSVANIQQAFAVGCMVDEIAAARGVSTYDQWMDMIGSDRLINPNDDIPADAQGMAYSNYNETLDRHPIDTARLKAVLKQVKDISGYGKDMPKGKGMGIAVHRSFVSYVACAIEVSVDDDGYYTVPRAWMVVDCGTAVNPDRVKAQMEGAVNFGLSIMKHGKITAENGAIVEGNFDGYPVVRMEEAPTVDVHIMDSTAVPGGVGEPGVPPVAPALHGALFQATGRRFRRLPIGDDLSV